MRNKAHAVSWGLFVIGATFTIIGISGQMGFLGAGIPLLVLGVGGLVYTRVKRSGGT